MNTEMTQSQHLEGNIWKYTLLLVANKRIFVAILGAYYLSIPGVTPWWIGIILLVSSLSGFALEIPSGYISDKIGHKKALVMAKVLTFLSTAVFLLADNITFLLIGGALMSIGNAFHSGTGSAFMHETLRALGREGDYTKVMGRASSIGFGVPIVLMVGVPFLVGINWHAPFAVALLVDVIGLFTAISLVSPNVSQEHIDEVNATNFKQVMREAYRLRFFRYAAFSGILGGMLFGIGGFRGAYQVFLDIPVIWFGVFFGIGRAIASLMLSQSERIRRLMGGAVSFYSWKLLIFFVLAVSLGFLENPWAIVVVFIVMNGFQWGLSQVSASHSMEIIKGSKFKATLLSVKSQINELVSAVSGFGLGLAIESMSYRFGFLLLAIVLLIVLLPLLLLIARDPRNRRPSAGEVTPDLP